MYGSVYYEIKHQIQLGWGNRKNNSAVLCDKRINARIKGRACKIVVRPDML
jgi:hypothetical protein